MDRHFRVSDRMMFGRGPPSVIDGPPGCCICFTGFSGRGYNDSRREIIPLVLKCTHSSCENCILTCLKMNKPITCGTCNQVSPFPPSDRPEDIKAFFPANMYLLGLWSKKTKEYFDGADSAISFPKKTVKKEMMSKKSFKPCNECTGAADCFCESCRSAYCHQCFKKVHAAAKVLKDHRSVSLIQEIEPVAPKSLSVMCSIHHDKKLELFCNNCYVSICSACLVSEHNGHKLTSIADKNKEYVDEIIASYAKLTDLMQIMKVSTKKAQQALKNPNNSSPTVSQEKRIKEHFVRLHAHLEIMENDLLWQLKTSSRITSLNTAIDKLSDSITRIKTSMAKTKKILGNDGFGDFGSLLQELRELESLPSILVASENNDDLNCLTVDPSIFCTLNEHIILRADDAISYQLKTENDAPDQALEDLPKTCSLEEIKSQLLPPQPVRPSSSNAGSLRPEYAVEKTGRICSPAFSRWSSNSSLSSNSSCPVETTRLLIPPDDLVVGVSFKATVTHITSPSDFYIQRCGVTKKKLESMEREMKRLASGFNRNESGGVVYQAGQRYMTMYPKDFHNWSRCQILDFVGFDEVKIFYIDFGNHETVPKSSLKPLPEYLANVTPLAARCSIVNCYPKIDNEWDPRAVSVMSRMIAGRGSTSVIIVRRNQLNSLTIRLYKETETSIIDVGEALVFLEYAQYGPPESFIPDTEPSRKVKLYPAQRWLRAEDIQNKTVDITRVVSPDEFYIIFIPLTREFMSLRNELRKDYSTRDRKLNDSRIVYYPAIGMAVAVPNENGFHDRALVVEMLPNRMVKVFFVDSGNTQVIEWDKLKTLELKYFKLPPQAYRCGMVDIQPKDSECWTEEAAALIQSYKGKNLKIANPEKNKHDISVILIHCDTNVDICVNALLVREGLARSTGPYGEIVEYPKVPSLVKTTEPSSVTGDDIKILHTPVAVQHQPVNLEKKEEIQMNLHDERVIKESDDALIKLRVTVRKVVNPGEFYVTVDYLDYKYDEVQAQMNEFYKKFNLNDVNNWEVNDKCAYKTVDGIWKRGMIVKQSEEGLQVNLVDDADNVTVPASLSGVLAPLDPKFCCLVDRTLDCILGGIVPAGSSTWTKTSIREMEDFLNTYKDNIYITRMKQLPGDGTRTRVLLYGRHTTKPTATEPAYDDWPNLNHVLRWKGCARADEHTKWDSKGNIIDERNNVMESEEAVINSLLRNAFHVTPEGLVDLSKPLSDLSSMYKVKWFPAVPLTTLSFVAKITFVGSNCEIWIQDPMSANKMLSVINEEACQMCAGPDPGGPPIPWENGDICLAKYHLDSKWYRSEIIQINAQHSHHLVRFVDYGNEEYVTNNELRPANGMTMRPIQAHICYFDNLASIGKTWMDSHIHQIHTLLVDKHVCIELRKLSNDLLGITNMVLPDGKNALKEIVTRRLGVYRDEILADSNEVYIQSASSSGEQDSGNYIAENAIPSTVDEKAVADSNKVNIQSASSGEQDPADSSSNAETVIPSTAGEEAVQSQEEYAPSSSFINWLSVYETEDKYELPDGGFRLLSIPPDVNELIVDITSILSPHLFMMVITKTDNAELNSALNSYNELVKTMQQEAESQPCLEPPYLDKFCCCKFEGDDMWYRAVVIHDSLDAVGGTLAVQYVDYGNVEECSVDRVKQMKAEWFSVPVQSVVCRIDGYTIRPDLSEPEAMVCLQSVLINQPFVKAVIKKRRKNISVEFLNEKGVLLYQPLIDSQHLKPSTSD